MLVLLLGGEFEDLNSAVTILLINRKEYAPCVWDLLKMSAVFTPVIYSSDSSKQV